ncbi:MAG: hypothetical protein OES24_11850, partial [Acidimicrobiia bacterium]|nr:hypothetical protein [Acidimicrobiia bacterium]
MTSNEPSSRLADPGLVESVAAMMNRAWTEPGFCVPNGEVYPHQWLWDSCFHSVVWATLDPSRARTEVANALANIGATGFVPHMTYWTDPDAHAELWARAKTSSITQPPMWGLALSEIAAHGETLDDALLDQAARGLIHLLENRPRSSGGLVSVLHPWETGCDDSARWDGWSTTPFSSPPFDRAGWKTDKVRLVGSLVFDDNGAPIDNRHFAIGSVGFSSLVAWNCELLAPLVALAADPEVAARARGLLAGRDELTAAVQARWDDDRTTWWDEPLRGGARPSCGARTLDSMLALLVDPRPDMFDQLVEPEAFGAPFGPRGVHRAEATYEPDQYWRGPAWPQLTYVLWRAAQKGARN